MTSGWKLRSASSVRSDASFCARRHRRDRAVAHEPHARADGGDAGLGRRAVARPDDPGVDAERAQRAGEPEHLALHPARRRQRVRRDDRDLHAAPPSPVGVRSVGRPVRLHQVPLLGGHADELLEAAGELLGDPTRHRRAGGPRARTDTGGPIFAIVPAPGPEVHAGRDERRAGAQRERRRARRASSCARRRTRPRPRRPRGRGRRAGRRSGWPSSARSTAAPASGPSGTTSMPIASRTPANHSKSSGGSTGSTTTVGATPRPASHVAGEVEPAEVREGEDHPRPGGERRLDVLPAHRVEAGLDRLAARHVAAGTARASSGRTTRTCPTTARSSAAPCEPSVGRALQVAGHEPPALSEERRERRGRCARPIGVADRARDRVRERGRAAVREVRRAIGASTGRERQRRSGPATACGARLAASLTARVGPALLAPAGQHRQPVVRRRRSSR